ncbi:hypothetical protein VQL36_05360 [Chengkuizengella sp. SCS-71B]|uniref:hypothetical protein n=1 Tax=Chengkuizengella sp. SCS-71B TaxID=3115290 RepID=UPI0032C22D5C
MKNYKRGEVAMEIKGNVVKDYMSGNTRMIFCDDDYINRTEEEETEIFNRVYQVAWECVFVLVEKGEEV